MSHLPISPNSTQVDTASLQKTQVPLNLSTLPIGHQIGSRKWILQRCLSHSQHEARWLAETPDHQQGVITCTLPLLSPLSREERNERITKLLAVNHPSIQNLIDHGFDDQYKIDYCVVLSSSGLLLSDLIKRRSLTIDEVTRLWTSIVSGLRLCHDQGLLHRRISPDTVIFTPDDKGILIDFDLTGMERSYNDIERYQYGSYVRFLSPEVVVNGRSNAYSDLYSLGKTMLEALCPGAYSWAEAPSLLRPIFERVLCPEPSRRGTLEELEWLLAHDKQRMYFSLDHMKERGPLTLNELISNLDDKPELQISTDVDTGYQPWRAHGEVLVALAQRGKICSLSTPLLNKELLPRVMTTSNDHKVSKERTRYGVQQELNKVTGSTDPRLNHLEIEKKVLLIAREDELNRKSGEQKIVHLGSVPLSLSYIPSGHFMMGSKDGGYENERPVHPVVITKGFWVSQTVITQAQWTEVIGNNPSAHLAPNKPVESITWFDAIAFTNLLSQRFGFQPAYHIGDTNDPQQLPAVEWTPHANGFRLLTEAEWEYTAKAGANFSYAGSNQIDEVAWYKDNANGETQPVGQKKANGWGLYDMSGNVFEWCHDTWQSNAYEGREQRINVDPVYYDSKPSPRPLRGGYCLNFPVYSRVSYHCRCNPDVFQSVVGLRVMRPAKLRKS